ncbi:MAG: hypothetical protein ACRD1V_19960 [Vicinamibacterales bacterium]
MSRDVRLTVAVAGVLSLAWLAAHFHVHGGWVSAAFAGLGAFLFQWIRSKPDTDRR